MRVSDLESPMDEMSGFQADVIHDVRKNKIIIPITLLCLFLAMLFLFFTSILPLSKKSEEAGKALGANLGTAAGKTVGSVEGATIGLAEGAQAGKEDGLSAIDTVAEIANTIENNITGLGGLEVLVANVDLTNYHEYNKTYGALYLLRGNAVFTIDLNKVTVTYKEGLISIVLPKPTAEIKIDASDTDILAEWENKFFNGNDKDGFKEYLNSIIEMTKNVSEDQVNNYDALINMASDSAVKQIAELANAVRGNDNEIIVTVSIQAE